MAHYTKFIPVGSYAVDVSLSVADITSEKAWWKQWINDKEYDVYLTENYMTVSAFRTPDKKFVVVIANEGEDKEISFNMLGYNASVYTTDAEKNLELTAETKGHKKIAVGAKSITTVVFER